MKNKNTVLSEEALKAMLGTPEVEATADPVLADEPVVEEDLEAEAQDEVVDLTEEFTVLSLAMEDIKTELATAKEEKDKLAADHVKELEAITASNEDLKSIVSQQISRMRIGLGLTAVDMTDFKVSAIVTEYNSISAKFMKLPVGSVIPEPTEKPKVRAVSSADSSAWKAVGLKLS